MTGPAILLALLAAAGVGPEIERAYLAGAYERVSQEAERRLEVGETGPELAVMLGRAEAARGLPRQARLAFAQAIEWGAYGAQRTEARLGIARAFLAEGETRAARRILEALAAETQAGGAADYAPEIRRLLGQDTEILRIWPDSPEGREIARARIAARAPAAAARSASTPPRAASSQGNFWLQMGAYRDRASAERFLRQLGRERGHPRGRVHKERLYLTLLGPYPSRSAAEAARASLAARGRRGIVREIRIRR